MLQDGHSLRTISAGIALLLNICLNFIFIPIFGIAGAGIATVISQILLFFLYFYFTSKYFHQLPLYKIILKPCISCIIMILFILIFKGINLFILVIFSAIIYFAILWMLKIFDSEDKKVFNNFLKPINQLLQKANSD